MKIFKGRVKNKEILRYRLFIEKEEEKSAKFFHYFSS